MEKKDNKKPKSKKTILAIPTEQEISLTLLTLPEVSRILKRSHKSIYHDIQRRRIPFVRIGGQLRFRHEDIRNFIDSLVVPIKERRNK